MSSRIDVLANSLVFAHIDGIHIGAKLNPHGMLVETDQPRPRLDGFGMCNEHFEQLRQHETKLIGRRFQPETEASAEHDVFSIVEVF